MNMGSTLSAGWNHGVTTMFPRCNLSSELDAKIAAPGLWTSNKIADP